VVHFLMAEDLVRERETELRRVAAQVNRPRRAGTRRQRLGWLLVETGLRLAANRPQLRHSQAGSRQSRPAWLPGAGRGVWRPGQTP
jgi:hypothetical protein